MTDCELFEAISLSIEPKPVWTTLSGVSAGKAWIDNKLSWQHRDWATAESVEILREKMCAEAAIHDFVVKKGISPIKDEWIIQAEGDKPTYWHVYTGRLPYLRAWIEAYAKWKGIL